MAMLVHFVCRGNSFRSIIAEAYLNSLQLGSVSAVSSGTVAAARKAENLLAYRLTLRLLAENGIREFAKPGYGDQLTQSRLAGSGLVICMNRRVYEECLGLVTLPGGTWIWSVADIGEPGRIAHTAAAKDQFRAQAYQEITQAVGRLVSGYCRSGRHGLPAAGHPQAG
jgi:protein-tyrosine-phosphatase